MTFLRNACRPRLQMGRRWQQRSEDQYPLGKTLTWYSFRHSYITMRLKAGTPVAVVAANTEGLQVHRGSLFPLPRRWSNWVAWEGRMTRGSISELNWVDNASTGDHGIYPRQKWPDRGVKSSWALSQGAWHGDRLVCVGKKTNQTHVSEHSLEVLWGDTSPTSASGIGKNQKVVSVWMPGTSTLPGELRRRPIRGPGGFVEVQTGSDNDERRLLPSLWQEENAVLVVAKLDRLNKVSFIASLMEKVFNSKWRRYLRRCLPTAHHATWQNKNVSSYPNEQSSTPTGKERGVKLGAPVQHIDALAVRKKAKALQTPRRWRVIVPLRRSGASLKTICEVLNASGARTARGAVQPTTGLKDARDLRFLFEVRFVVLLQCLSFSNVFAIEVGSVLEEGVKPHTLTAIRKPWRPPLRPLEHSKCRKGEPSTGNK